MLHEGSQVHSNGFGPISITRKLGEGGQGSVYLVNAGGRDLVLKWYKAAWSTAAQRDALRDLANQGPPKRPADAGARFVWPLEVIEDGEDRFGYLMELIDDSYVDHGRIRGSGEWRPSVLCEMSLQLVRSFRALHLTGHCYQDISDQNILVNPESGDILICDNDNVVVDGAATASLGTTKFMAPEVVTGQCNPSTKTDLHSLATLLFYFWIWHHPLHGRREAAMRLMSEAEEQELYGTDPVFIFDPENPQNALPDPNNAPEYQPVAARWELCPRSVKELFIEAFTDGLRDTNRRVVAGKWHSVFLRLRDSIVECSACGDGAEILAEIDDPESQKCRKCGFRLPSFLRFSIRQGNRQLVLPILPEAQIRSYHLSLSDDDEIGGTAPVVGAVARHPNDPKVWGLRNESTEPWMAKSAKGAVSEIPPGRAAVISLGLELQIGSAVVSISDQ